MLTESKKVSSLLRVSIHSCELVSMLVVILSTHTPTIASALPYNSELHAYVDRLHEVDWLELGLQLAKRLDETWGSGEGSLNRRRGGVVLDQGLNLELPGVGDIRGNDLHEKREEMDFTPKQDHDMYEDDDNIANPSLDSVDSDIGQEYPEYVNGRRASDEEVADILRMMFSTAAAQDDGADDWASFKQGRLGGDLPTDDTDHDVGIHSASGGRFNPSSPFETQPLAISDNVDNDHKNLLIASQGWPNFPGRGSHNEGVDVPKYKPTRAKRQNTGGTLSMSLSLTVLRDMIRAQNIRRQHISMSKLSKLGR